MGELQSVAFTNGFSSEGQLRTHFKKWGVIVGTATSAEYLECADTFVGSPLSPGVLELVRPDGDRVRYNPDTDEFGVLDLKTGCIRTYFRRQGTKPENLAYFEKQRLRIFP